MNIDHEIYVHMYINTYVLICLHVCVGCIYIYIYIYIYLCMHIYYRVSACFLGPRQTLHFMRIAQTNRKCGFAAKGSHVF